MNSVELSSNSINYIDEIGDWCMETIGENGWTVGIGKNCLVWKFDLESDAALFVLRWGQV